MKRPTLLSPLAAVPRAEPWRWRIVIFLGYLCLGIVFTWPMALHFGDGVIQRGDLPVDSGQGIWNLWWARTTLLHGANPFVTTHLFHPLELNLFYQTLSLPNALLVFPVLWAAGPIAAFNTVTLLSFALGGYWSYRLAYAFKLERSAALLAGFVVAFTPYHVQRVWGGSMELIAIHWLPLYLLLFVHAMARLTPGSVMAAGIGLFVTTLASQYHGLYAAVYTAAHGLLAALLAAPGLRLRTFGAAAGVGVIWVGLMLPVALLAGGLGGVALEDWYMRQNFHSVALVDLIAPHGLHPLWGDAAMAWHTRLHPFGIETGAGFGLGVLLLCAVALWRRWIKAWPWALLALFCLLLAMGPQLRLTESASPIPGPFMLLNSSEVFRNSSRPAIFVALMVLPMAMLAALGLDGLRGGQAVRGRGSEGEHTWVHGRTESMPIATKECKETQKSWLARRSLGLAGGVAVAEPVAATATLKEGEQVSSLLASPHRLFALLLSALVVCESLVAPWKILPLAVAPEISALNNDPLVGAVLELPPQLNDSRALLNQMCHGRPLMGGYLARLPPYPSVSEPSVAQQLWRAEPPTSDIMRLDAGTELANRGVRFVVLHLPILSPSERANLQAWLTAPGLTLTTANEDHAIYAVDPAVAQPTITLGSGWYDGERDGQRHWRWMQARAEVKLLAREQAMARLQIQATAYGKARPLEIWAGEQMLRRTVIPAAPFDQSIVLRLLLAPGETTLALVSPADVSPDGRNLSLSLSLLQLEVLPSAAGRTTEALLPIPATFPALPMVPCME